MVREDKRISEIKEQRKELLFRVKESITTNNDKVTRSNEDILWLLDLYDKNSKKYEAIVKAQELILNLTKEIAECNDVEQIMTIRNKLNYYIRKIKSELNSRNIDGRIVDEYYNNVSYLRKDIAKYIRYLKRNDNILEIERLNRNINNLSAEDREKLRKLLRNEKRYNNNNLNPKKVNKKNKKSKLSIMDELSREPLIFTNNADNNDFKIDSIFGSDTLEFHFSNEGRKKNIIDEFDTEKAIIDFVPEKMDEEAYLSGRVNMYSKKYGIEDTYQYDDSFGKCLINLFRNIPIYVANKSRIKYMKRDHQTYYSGSDLTGYIEYIKKQSSIGYALKSIFSKSYLYSREGQYLNNQKKCASWIREFCDNQEYETKHLTKQMI